MSMTFILLHEHHVQSLRVFGVRSPVVIVTLPGSVHRETDDWKYLLMASAVFHSPI